MSCHIWYCAELDVFKIDDFPPFSILKVKGWKEFAYWAIPNKPNKAFNKTGLVEYIYIGPL